MQQRGSVSWKRTIPILVLLVLAGLSAYYLGLRMYYRTSWNNVHLLVAQGHVGRLEAVLSKDPSLVNARWDGSTPLHMVGYTPSHYDAEVVRILIEYGADVNALDRLGITALYFAAAEGKFDAVKVLIQAGADPTAGDSLHGLPVEVAAQQGHDDIVRFLSELAKLREPDG